MTEEVTTKQSAQERAAAQFWAAGQVAGPEPEVSQGYPFAWLDEILNFWDRRTWWQRLGFSCVLVAVLWLVVEVLLGYRK